jgi:hypothetical protein
MNTPEAFLGFSNSLAKLSPAPVVCQWSSSEQVMKWHEHDVTYAAGEVVPIDDYGTARATFSLKGQGHWVGPSDHAKAPNEIGLQLKLDNHFSTTITTDRVSWWAELFGGSSSLPDEYKDLSPPAPNFDIKIALNYFLTTNLILPGMWLFNADDPVGVDDNHGFALPQDAILTGKINDQLPDAIAERNKNLTDAYIRGVRLATATKAEKDIIQGVLSDPIHHIVGDLLRTISKSATGTGLDIIHSIGNSGYHGISSEVLLNAFGYSSSRAWEALCGFSALRTGSRHGDLVADVVVSSNPPDVRIFGGRYKILSVDVDSNASQTLIINPRSGEVTYEQKTSLPIISIDKATGQAWVLFTRGVQRFRMLFMAYLHGPTPVFTIAFEGTVVDDTGRQRPFCGRLDQHVNKIDDYIDNLGILNYNGFMITFISTIALCYLKYTEGKKSNALDEALQTNYSTLTRTYESFKDLVAEEAGRKFKESPALQLLIQGSRDKLRSSLAEAVREVLAKIPIDSSLYNFNPKLDLFPDRFFAVSAAADNVTEKVLRAGIGGVSYGVLDTVVQPQVHNNMLLPSDVDLVRTYATEAAIRSFKAKLAEPSGLCLSFLHASVALEILNWGIRKRSQELVDRATNVKALKKQQDTMQGELATLSELIIVEEERSRDRSLADDLREEAQELVAALQLKTIEREAELEEQEAQIKKLMNMVTVLENEQNEADKLKKEMENQQNNAEKRVFGT